MTIAQQIASVRRSAEKMQAAGMEVIGTASIGDVVRQGDLYLVCIADCPAGTPAPRQLAPGTTQGSRHVAQGNCDVLEIHDKAGVAKQLNVPQELLGPAVRVRDEATITHPEHGDKALPRETIWVCVYQRAYADEVRRVQD